MSIKAIIVVTLGGDGQVTTHDQTVRTAFIDASGLSGSEVAYSSELPVSNSIQDTLDYAGLLGACWIKSTTGITDIIDGYDLNYPEALVFMPLGSNTYEEITSLTSIPVIVTCCAGRNCSWWEARYCARKTASQKGIWDKYNGYGLINVADAIAFNGTIPLDPYDETLVTGMERLSNNFKFWGQTDVTFAELTKSFAYYERISGL